MSPPRRPPLVEVPCRKVLSASVYRRYWVRRSRLGVAVSVAPSGVPAAAIPHGLTPRVHPLQLQASFRVSRAQSRREVRSRGCSRPPPWGYTPLRDINTWSPLARRLAPSCRRRPKPASFRPRRFSRPRRFPPPRALWVCFTPQPRPGFTLQGFAPPHSRTSSSPAVALVSLPPSPCRLILIFGARREPLAFRALLRAEIRCEHAGS
jgi:hypothetical protein